MKIAIGSDHGGFLLKQELVPFIQELGHEVEDVGCHSPESTDYPVQAKAVVELVKSRGADRGILICGTGIGMSMAANRHPGIRAALCHEIFTARMSRAHNDANVLCMGARVIGPGLAREMVREWLSTPFDGGRHSRRVCMFDPEADCKKG
jgi:ribose 5-phosphate isomerase B